MPGGRRSSPGPTAGPPQAARGPPSSGLAARCAPPGPTAVGRAHPGHRAPAPRHRRRRSEGAPRRDECGLGDCTIEAASSSPAGSSSAIAPGARCPPSTSKASARLRAAPRDQPRTMRRAVSMASRPCPQANAASANSASSSARWPLVASGAALRSSATAAASPSNHRTAADSAPYGPSHRYRCLRSSAGACHPDRRVPSSSRATARVTHVLVVPVGEVGRSLVRDSGAPEVATLSRSPRERHSWPAPRWRPARRCHRRAATPVRARAVARSSMRPAGGVHGPTGRGVQPVVRDDLEHRPAGSERCTGHGDEAGSFEVGERVAGMAESVQRGRGPPRRRRLCRRRSQRAPCGPRCSRPRGAGRGQWRRDSGASERSGRPRARRAGQETVSARARWRPPCCRRRTTPCGAPPNRWQARPLARRRPASRCRVRRAPRGRH